MKKIIQFLKNNILIIFLISYLIFLLFILYYIIQLNTPILREFLLLIFTLSAILFPTYLHKNYFFPLFKSLYLRNDTYTYEYLIVTLSKDMEKLYVNVRIDMFDTQTFIKNIESSHHLKDIRKITGKFDLSSINKKDILTLVIYFHEKYLTKQFKDKYKTQIRKHKLEKIISQ